MQAPRDIYPGKLLLIAACMLALAGETGAQQRVVLAEESRLWIEGQTSVNRFACEARSFAGEGVLAGGNVLSGSPAKRGASRGIQRHVARLVVPVRQFDCGKDRMNADLYEALKAETHPEIVFELEEAEVVGPRRDSTVALRVDGRLRIAGVENDITLTVTAWPAGAGRYRARGGYPLRMSDYGVDPPRALLGLIRVQDQIVVRFDLVAVPADSLKNEKSR
ncbi:YceI family protein [Rhodocaloribacter litoris]|uniref:YceI family protein n=1 Tax=Rhodocaloribacter litoris TaxID=2558931 RepID=UPI001420A0EB|nr:YceI family protein [Rhodocaloribacter litoris]QXD14642.1 YceI family protein [Rhodocaloribacter litoris]GIV59584.1 MAG: hypothetical protein KatS3mg043_0673 [Rhodothermaceae bacterium]